jgi:hypothetical protein
VNGETRGGLPWFFAWTAVGAGYAFAILAALSIGVYVLAITVVATVLLVRSPSASSGLTGIVSGLGLPLLYVAFLNRSGPGTVCTTTLTGQSCVDEWSPWPWLLAGVLLVVAGCGWFAVRSYRRV